MNFKDTFYYFSAQKAASTAIPYHCIMYICCIEQYGLTQYYNVMIIFTSSTIPRLLHPAHEGGRTVVRVCEEAAAPGARADSPASYSGGGGPGLQRGAELFQDSRTTSRNRAPPAASELYPALGNRYRLTAEKREDESSLGPDLAVTWALKELF
ncbi:hypothetical protein J6590_087539 [Homalodisca vitripennis]|nr:hypothetical protein J6590_087539 [Homalodisca vitripennis]